MEEDPARALEHAETAIELFAALKRRYPEQGGNHQAAPFYVKAVSLVRLGRVREALETCRVGLAAVHHPGLEELASQLERRLR